jgi:NAD(P)-dependent dehydrogenase (short-subunit alcohol dehydrogenase family)
MKGPLSLLDTALDRALIGYGNVGYVVRRRAWSDEDFESLAGKVVLVTGAKTGLGKATVAGLARHRATVRMVIRGRESGEAARREILEDVPGAEIVVDECDVSLLEDVRAYAARFDGPLHAVIHNAGVMPRQRSETREGNELTLATHVLGPHLLTQLLRPQAPGRIIWVSSGGMYAQRLHLDDLQYREGEYNPTTAYARTKRMQVTLAHEWAQRLRGDGVVVHCMHPGWVDTPGIASGLPAFERLTRPILRTPEQGADTAIWLASAGKPGQTTGRFWHDRRARPEHYTRLTRESQAERDAMWAAVERLTEP